MTTTTITPNTGSVAEKNPSVANRLWGRTKATARKAWATIKRNLRMMKEFLSKMPKPAWAGVAIVTSGLLFAALLGPTEAAILILYMGAVMMLAFGFSYLLTELLLPDF